MRRNQQLRQDCYNKGLIANKGLIKCPLLQFLKAKHILANRYYNILFK